MKGIISMISFRGNSMVKVGIRPQKALVALAYFKG